MGRFLDELRMRAAIEQDKIAEEQAKGVKPPVNGLAIVIGIILIILVIAATIFFATLETGQLAFFGIVGICLFGAIKGLMR